MSNESVIYTGDLEPPFVGTLSAADPVDSTAVPNRLIGTRAGVIVLDEVIADKVKVGDTTVVTFNWLVPFTEPGPIDFEVEVTWPGDRKQTFPACNTFIVRRDADLP